MMILDKKWAATAGAVFCTVLWGSAYPVIKFAYQQLKIESVGDRLMFAGLRFFLAGVMVFFITFFFKKRVPAVEKKDVLPVIAYGAVQTGLMYLFNYIGVANTTATKTAILTSLSAFLAVLFSPLFFKDEKLSALKIAGIVLGLSGILFSNVGAFDGTFSLFGEGFVMFAAVLNTAGGFIGKKISGGKVFEMTAYQLIIGGVILIFCAAIGGGHFSLTLKGGAILLYLAFVSAAAFSVWTALLVRHEAGKILVFNLLIPIFGAVWSFFILGEKDIFEPMNLLSVALITAGIVLVNSNRKTAEISTRKK